MHGARNRVNLRWAASLAEVVEDPEELLDLFKESDAEMPPSSPELLSWLPIHTPRDLHVPAWSGCAEWGGFDIKQALIDARIRGGKIPSVEEIRQAAAIQYTAFIGKNVKRVQQIYLSVVEVRTIVYCVSLAKSTINMVKKKVEGFSAYKRQGLLGGISVANLIVTT